MIEPIEAVNPSQLVPQANGHVTVTIRNPTGIKRGDGTPAKVGDVYSCNPVALPAYGFSWQARPKGANGVYELAVVVGAAVVFAPLGKNGVAVMLPFAASVPNG